MRKLMKKLIRKSVKKDQEGAVLLEFALISPVLLLLIMGLFDFGYSIYARTVLTGAIQTAGRNSSLETASANLRSIDERLSNTVRDVVPFGSVSVDRRSYFDFFDVERAEAFTDIDNNGQCNDGEPYFDENQNDRWDTDVGAAGVGGSQDVVLLEVTVRYNKIFPFYRLIGASPENIITAGTVLRNQPFGPQAVRPAGSEKNC